MTNQDTGVSAEQLSFNGFESLPATLTIYTHGIPNPKGNCCFWSWVAFDRDNKRVAADNGVHSDTHGTSNNIAIISRADRGVELDCHK